MKKRAQSEPVAFAKQCKSPELNYLFESFELWVNLTEDKIIISKIIVIKIIEVSACLLLVQFSLLIYIITFVF